MGDNRVAAFHHVYHGNIVYDKANSHFYQNPRATRKVWCTVGSGYKNKQICPSFEPWMERFITEEQYSQLAQILEMQFNESPDDLSPSQQFWAIMSCCLTFGICFCWCLYFMYRRRKLNLSRFRITAAFNDQARDMSNVCLHFADRILPGAGCWIDSRNQPLDFGPPPGYSIVFTLEEEMEWPPAVTNQPSQTVSSAPPPYALKERGALNLSAEFEQDNFCTNCGKKVTAEHKFCGKCGSPCH